MLKIFTKLFCLILVFSLFLFSGCARKTNSGSSAENAKIKVFTSFYPMYDFAGKIGGDKINLTNLVPAGTEPHDWEPTPKDIAAVEKADVLIYNGAGMEIWMDKVLKSVKNKNLIVVEAAKNIKLLENTEEHEEDGKEENESDHEDLLYDPHVWLNPMNAKKQMESIKEALIKVDPENKDFYQKNFEDNAAEFDKLNKEFADAVAGFARKDIIVSHEAFGYLCDAFGLQQVGIEGLSAESEPTPARMAEIARFARENNVKVIFFEELVSPKIAETIAKEVGAQTLMLNPLEGLSEEDVKAGKDYFTIMRDNLETLKKALK